MIHLITSEKPNEAGPVEMLSLAEYQEAARSGRVLDPETTVILVPLVALREYEQGIRTMIDTTFAHLRESWRRAAAVEGTPAPRTGKGC